MLSCCYYSIHEGSIFSVNKSNTISFYYSFFIISYFFCLDENRQCCYFPISVLEVDFPLLKVSHRSCLYLPIFASVWQTLPAKTLICTWRKQRVQWVSQNLIAMFYWLDFEVKSYISTFSYNSIKIVFSYIPSNFLLSLKKKNKQHFEQLQL